ncbi:MAG: hypothetical protein M1495_03165 [Bacteroidetes bacterium]|nr:hypothetical protein [Bacteroidota bacterium]
MNYAGFNFAVTDGLEFTQYQKIGKYVPITGNLEQMKYFIEALKNSKNEKVRIAHYGDSLIMGDVITEYLRNKFQMKYGGNGVGMLSIVADDSRMKRTVTQTYSDNWTYASIVSGDREQYPLGMNGTVCVPKPGSWVQYEASRVFDNVSSFGLVRLLYSNADRTSTIEYAFDNDQPIEINLENGTGVKQLILDAKRKVTKVRIKFISGKAPYMYSTSLESAGYGVYVDNFSMRGNSGVSLLDISSDTYKEYNQFVNYNLIILNFGANVSFADRSAYILYENKMEEVIEKLKKAFPHTSFLLVGVGDKTMKRGSRFMTNPDIPFLIDIQKRIVEKTGIAYWNLWEVMGGDNSMYSWVNAAPPLAFRDYVHFNSEGGEIIANLLFEALNNLRQD